MTNKTATAYRLLPVGVGLAIIAFLFAMFPKLGVATTPGVDLGLVIDSKDHSSTNEAQISEAGSKFAWNSSAKRLPPSVYGYAITAAGDKLFFVDTTPNATRIWMSDRSSTEASFVELSFDRALLYSSWIWQPEITSITTLRIDGMERVFVAGSGGILELVWKNGNTNVLVPFWSFKYDTSYGLRAVTGGTRLLWVVGSFGTQSGYHQWSVADGFQFLGVGEAGVDRNRILDTSARTFGWTDVRGFIWSGSSTPPLLLGFNPQSRGSRYSTDGGNSWQQVRDVDGQIIDAFFVTKEFNGLLFAVDTNGHLYKWTTENPCLEDLQLSAVYPSTQFYDAETGLVIVGTKDGLYTTYLPHNKAVLPLPAGGAGSVSTLAASGALSVGYAVAAIDNGSPFSGTAVYIYTRDGVVVSEVGVPASPPTRDARFLVDTRSNVASGSGVINVRTGFAAVNPNATAANVTLTLRDVSGTVLSQGNMQLAAGEHVAKFLDQMAPSFILPAGFIDNGLGTLDVAGDQAVSVLALRLTVNQRGDLVMSSTPIADITSPAPSAGMSFPQIADGGGYATTLILMNTTGFLQSGVVRFHNDSGSPLSVRMTHSGAAASQFPYVIRPGGFLRLVTDASPSNVNVGWAQLVPDYAGLTPISAAIFSYTQHGILITESGVPAAKATTRARIYVDKTGAHNTGLAMANPESTNIRISATAYQLDGITPAGKGAGFVDLPPFGHDARFADQIIAGLPEGFSGVLDLSSSTPFCALTMRSLTNSRGEFLVATFPLADMTEVQAVPMIFPQIAAGGGYQTQIILLSMNGTESTATISLYDNSGSPLDILSASETLGVDDPQGYMSGSSPNCLISSCGGVTDQQRGHNLIPDTARTSSVIQRNFQFRATRCVGHRDGTGNYMT